MDPLKGAARLLDEEELARLSERARLDAHTGVHGLKDGVDEGLSDEEEDALREREYALFVRGLVGLRYCARTYTLLRDARGLTPIVWGSWALGAEAFDMHRHPAEQIADAVTSAGVRVLEVAGLNERLACSPYAAVRLALARVLPPSAEPILTVLADDDDAAVRAAARAKIPIEDEWAGVFPISPEGHARELLEAARAVLEAAPLDINHDPDRAIAALAPLSDSLAVGCWERLLSSELVVTEQAWPPWLARLLDRPGGGRALARMASRWAGRGVSFGREHWMADAARLEEQARSRATAEILESMRSMASEDPERTSSARLMLAHAVVLIAPAKGDAVALLETILGSTMDDATSASPTIDTAAFRLCDVLARWPLEAIAQPLIEARRAGRRGRWTRITQAVWARLGPDPVIRERAMKDLESEDILVRRGAVHVVLAEHRDPERADALARDLYLRSPELRSTVLWYAPFLLPEARSALTRGELHLSAAIAVLHGTPNASDQDDGMWASVRELRAAALAETGEQRDDVFNSVHVLVREGDLWDASDLAFVREAIDLALGSDEEAFRLDSIVEAIGRVDAAESDELIAELEERASSEEMRECLESALARRRRKLAGD